MVLRSSLPARRPNDKYCSPTHPLERMSSFCTRPQVRLNPNAWARIRTWEPLREGILSPSPLTGLGYPRATREMPGTVKPFPWDRRGDESAKPFSDLADFPISRGFHGPVFFGGVLRRGREPPQRGPGVGEARRDRDGENRVDVHRPERVVPARHRRREGKRQRRRARRPRGLQVRGNLRRVDAARQGGAGLPGPRPRRQDPVSRLDAEDHGAHGTAEPHHAGGSTGPEGVLAARQNMETATPAVTISST